MRRDSDWEICRMEPANIIKTLQGIIHDLKEGEYLDAELRWREQKCINPKNSTEKGFEAAERLGFEIITLYLVRKDGLIAKAMPFADEANEGSQ